MQVVNSGWAIDSKRAGLVGCQSRERTENCVWEGRFGWTAQRLPAVASALTAGAGALFKRLGMSVNHPWGNRKHLPSLCRAQ